jgi:TonB family protein
VRDPSGARVPNCTVIAKQLDTGNQETATADVTGEYRFASILSGRYTLSFAASGFRMLKRELTLVSGAMTQVDANLEVGSVNESVRVLGGPKPSATPQPAKSATRLAERIRIGGNVSTARLITQPKPVYPAELKDLGVEGTVLLSAIIGKDGTIQNVKVVQTPDERLSKAAIEAVKQWRYEPARLNGEPIEVLSEIDMQYYLGK